MTSESDPIDAQLLKRYRQASDADPVAPTDAARAAILAEGRRAAQQTSTLRPAFDTSQPAANQSRFKLAAFGTLGAVLLTALIAVPQLWEHPPALTATHQSSGAANSPASAQNVEALSSRAPAPSPPPSPSATPPAAAEAQLDEVIVAQRSAERALASASNEKRMAASLQRRKTDADNYTPNPPMAAGHPDRLSSFAAQSPAPSSDSAASSAQSAPAAALDAHGASAVAGPAAIAKLSDQGAALDTRDNLGRTPLMRATLGGQVENVRSLLGRGANPNIADNEGRTPLQAAKAGHFEEITQVLEVAGAH
jgi:Ankyrin repeats (many copies)